MWMSSSSTLLLPSSYEFLSFAAVFTSTASVVCSWSFGTAKHPLGPQLLMLLSFVVVELGASALLL